VRYKERGPTTVGFGEDYYNSYDGFKLITKETILPYSSNTVLFGSTLYELLSQHISFG
jgi:NADH:ubiquinone oxidoreductase subunit H